MKPKEAKGKGKEKKEKKKSGGGGGGLQNVLQLSEALQKVVGAKELPRTAVTKQIWVYIKERNLQVTR